MVKKTSFLEKLKGRWKTGAGMRVDRPEGVPGIPDAVAERLGSAATPAKAVGPSEKAASKKLSPREDAMVQMGERFQELSNLIRGVQARVEDHGLRGAEIAEDIRSLPALGRAQIALLKRLADHVEKQDLLGHKLVQTLDGVQVALARAAAADERHAETMRAFVATMDRMESAMGRVADSSRTQAEATAALVRARQAEQEEIVGAIREGRREDVKVLAQSQREGAERIEQATTEQLTALRERQDQHAEHVQQLVLANGKRTSVIVVLLSLTFLTLAGILTALLI